MPAPKRLSCGAKFASLSCHFSPEIKDKAVPGLAGHHLLYKNGL